LGIAVGTLFFCLRAVSGILIKNPNEFLDWVNSSVDVLSFQLKVPTLEQIFLIEVGQKK
jgi:ABC-type uncharacterized transport system ATPase subunit